MSYNSLIKIMCALSCAVHYLCLILPSQFFSENKVDWMDSQSAKYFICRLFTFINLNHNGSIAVYNCLLSPHQKPEKIRRKEKVVQRNLKQMQQNNLKQSKILEEDWGPQLCHWGYCETCTWNNNKNINRISYTQYIQCWNLVSSCYMEKAWISSCQAINNSSRWAEFPDDVVIYHALCNIYDWSMVSSKKSCSLNVKGVLQDMHLLFLMMDLVFYHVG